MRKKQQGRCIFCSGLGLSKQHVIPNWISSLGFPSADNHNQYVYGGKFYLGDGINSERPSVVNHWSKKHNGVLEQRKVRSVCIRCNNGWISVVEQTAKPLIEKMIRGEQVRLEKNDCYKLALAFVLMSILFEYTAPKPRSIIVRPSMLADIMERKEVPKGWEVGVIPLEEGDKIATRQHKNRVIADKQVLNGGYSGYLITTCLIGHLMFQTFLKIGINCTAGYAPPICREIWPNYLPSESWDSGIQRRDLKFYDVYANNIHDRMQEGDFLLLSSYTPLFW